MGVLGVGSSSTDLELPPGWDTWFEVWVTPMVLMQSLMQQRSRRISEVVRQQRSGDDAML
jgi:hypothetical protein